MATKGLQVIYEPKGAAAEYAELACNLYATCRHGCRYCYCPRVLHKKAAEFFADGPPRHNVFEKLEADCEKLEGDPREVLLSFVGDPCQSDEAVMITRKALHLFAAWEMRAAVLTKAGARAVGLFDLLERYGWRFGTSLVWTDQADCRAWEPEAALPGARTAAITEAHHRGIRTWVSLEPVIDPEQALQLINDWAPVVDFWAVGKINHCDQLESRVDWWKFYAEVTRALEKVGADYYMKRSLWKYRGGWPVAAGEQPVGRRIE